MRFQHIKRQAGWRDPRRPAFMARVEVTQQPRWYLDGNYTRTRPIEWKHVEQFLQAA